MSVLFDDVIANVQDAVSNARGSNSGGAPPGAPSPERDPAVQRLLQKQIERLERKEARTRAT